MNVFSLITSTVQEISDNGLQQSGLKIGLKIICLYHRGKAFIQRTKVYMEPQNIFPYMVGNILYYTVDNKTLKTYAKVFLILECFENCVKKIQVLQKLCQKYKKVIFSYQLNQIELEKKESLSITCKAQLWSHLIYKILSITMQFFNELVALSFATWEIYEAFYADDKAVQECVMNTIKWSEMLHNNKALLKEKLTKNKITIDAIFRGLHIENKISAQAFIEGIHKFLDTADLTTRPVVVLFQSVTTICSKVFDAVYDCFDRTTSKQVETIHNPLACTSRLMV